MTYITMKAVTNINIMYRTYTYHPVRGRGDFKVMHCYQAPLFKYPSASEKVDVPLAVKDFVCLLVFMMAKSVTPSGLFAVVPMSKWYTQIPFSG